MNWKECFGWSKRHCSNNRWRSRGIDAGVANGSQQDRRIPRNLPERAVTIEQSYSCPAPHNIAMTAQLNPSLEASCPTCGARPGEKCELNVGLTSIEPYTDRRLDASENQQSKNHSGA